LFARENHQDSKRGTLETWNSSQNFGKSGERRKGRTEEQKAITSTEEVTVFACVATGCETRKQKRVSYCAVEGERGRRLLQR